MRLKLDKGYRISVIESLKKIFKDKSYSNIVINNHIKNIDRKYDALYRKSVLGVIENLIFIDWVIDRISSVKTKKMELEVLAALRLAVYQLYFLENSQENIIVNESVEYIKAKVNLRASKFTNAVLRNIIRNKNSIINDLEQLSGNEYLSIKYSYPMWLVDKWALQFGNDKIQEVLSAGNSQAPVEIRVNTLRISRDDLMLLLEKKGLRVHKCKIADKGLVIENPVGLDKYDEYKNGLFSVQGESSMLVGQILKPEKESFIIDLCSAPGGKSLDSGEWMENTGKILSRDIYKNKLQLIKNEIKRLGLGNIETEVYDAQIPDESLEGRADYCIVDVPCSGLGIIRRKPEIKYKGPDESLEDITGIQYKILENASRYLKPGGELVYSTCTVSREENINIINKFLSKNKNFTPVDISAETKNLFQSSSRGYIEIYPHIHNMDGFFIAKLKKM